MLKKIILASAVGVALLANASVIASADESYAETSVVTETDLASVSEKAAIASKESSSEETTTTETSSPAEVGKNMRKNLEVKVMDIVTFDDVSHLYDKEGNVMDVEAGWRVWIIGIDDENQRFRVQAPKVTPTGEKVTYLTYNDAENAVVISHEGRVMGDLCRDGVVDVFDMCLIRRGYIYGWENSTNKLLADMNADGEATIADLIWMQKWLLGVIK